MKRKNIKNKIMEYFFINPTIKLRVRQIERVLNIPLPSVIRYCKELRKEGILKVVKIGDVVFYTSNRGNEKFFLEKMLFNIRHLYDSGFVSYLRRELSNPTIVLFGSYSRGEDIESSDIDIYIETPSKKQIDVRRFEKVLKRRVQIFRHKNLKEIGNKELVNSIINGIVLNGFIEVF